MVKIICPNKQYNGLSASVPFTNGIGETGNPHLIKWFKEHGYTVEDEQQGGEGAIGDMTVKELKAYAVEKNIDLGEAKTKADIVAAIQKAEAEAEADNGGDDDEGNGEGGEGENE